MANRQLFFFLFITISVFYNIDVHGQSSLTYKWYVNANAGLTQMYGDLQNENNPISKLQSETDLGFGIRAGHYFSPKISGHLQVTQLSFKGSKSSNNIGFNTTMTEIQIGWAANLTNLAFGDKERLFNLYGFTGLNGMIFSSEAYTLSTGEIVNGDGEEDNSKTTPEFAISVPIGLGLDIRLTEKWYMNLETGLRLSTSDLLDGYIRGGKGDAYYYTSLGISYNFKIKKTQRIPEGPPVIASKPVNPYENEIIDLMYNFPDDLESMDEFTMKCRIVKGKIDGKAELTQILPIGFNVKDTLIGNARTEFKNYTLTLYWDEIPTDSIFEISYNVELDKIYGKLPMTSIIYFANTGKEHRFRTDVFIKRKIVAEPIAVVDEKPSQKDMSSPSEKVEFRIQLRASYKKKLNPENLAKQFNIDKPIKEELIDGWYKYSVGSFKTYNEAREYRKELVSVQKVQGAFIIAYYDNERLNTLSELRDIVPEALPGGSQPAKPKYQETGLCYRVQIFALQEKQVVPSVIKEMYQIEQTVNEEVFHNFSKYTVGDCLSKQEALNLRLELISKGLDGCFLVAYKNGERN
ncbi:MAG: outer membrane beta-barrel protein [Bacteroidales bacterium]